MTRMLLTLNAGSSSIKFALFDAAEPGPRQKLHGQIEGLGSIPHLLLKTAAGDVLADRTFAAHALTDHERALDEVMNVLAAHGAAGNIAGVGHRVVHGGPELTAPVVVTDAILQQLEGYAALAPLHQPHNLAGIQSARRAYPHAVQVACFDTAFHRAHSWVNDTFALPRRYYEQGVRRYGFHGLSYEYVTGRLRELAPHHAAGRVVVAHLGSGASMCAIRDGQSIGSTMGFSALDGLPMGTRPGQLDPGVLLYLLDHEELSSREIAELLYKESGLKGLSGLSGDMRVLETAGTLEAQQAIDYFVFRVRRELGAMTAILGGLDALVFCGGIGEHAWRIRERVCSGFEWLGLEIDECQNRSGAGIISSAISRVRVFVIQTDEEAVIARHTQERLSTTT